MIYYSYMNHQYGFTKLEFIIMTGVLIFFTAVLGFVISSSQKETRDIIRLSDVKRLSIIMEQQNVFTPKAPLVGCDVPYDAVTECSGPGIIGEFQSFLDSSVEYAPCAGAGLGVSREKCFYSISSSDGTDGARLDDYQICFWLEQNAQTLKRGLHAIKTGGTLGPCN